MDHRQDTRLIAAIMLFSFMLTACGGGGGEGDGDGDGSVPGYSNGSLNGRYYGGHFNLNPSGTESTFNAMTFDGKGRATADLDHNRIESGVGTVFSQHVDGTYSVQPDARTTFVATLGSTSSATPGMVGAGGDSLILSRLDDTTIHNLSFGFKAGTGHTVGKLKGNYHGVGLKCTRPFREVTGFYGSCSWLNERNAFNLDGAGNYSTSSWNPATLVSEPNTDSGVYTVEADGTGTVTSTRPTTDGIARKVWFSADGSLLVQTEIVDNRQQTLYVGMRKGSGYSNSTLKGTYSFGLFERSASSQTSAIGTLVFDGTGGVILQGTFSDQENINQPSKTTTSYTVSPGGLMTLTVGHGALQGVVSADGGTLAIVPWESSTHGMLVATKQ